MGFFLDAHEIPTKDRNLDNSYVCVYHNELFNDDTLNIWEKPKDRIGKERKTSGKEKK